MLICSISMADDISIGFNALNSGNYELALKKFRDYAEKGNAAAQHNLALMYYRGNGVPVNYLESLRLYQLAAEQGLRDSQFNLGMMYSNGIGTIKSD
jgi:uncharacterized protein